MHIYIYIYMCVFVCDMQEFFNTASTAGSKVTTKCLLASLEAMETVPVIPLGSP